jgi:hypothetical protein
MGVYITPTNTKLVVAGIYGPSANDDWESQAFYQEVKQTIEELQNTFHISDLLLAGDFNAVLHPMDSSSEHITKKRTTELLHTIMEDFHPEDLANVTGNKQHTWYRRNNNQISSRLDMILTNLPIINPKYVTKHTIFDHAWTQASFGQKREQTNATMKDYILGSEEFLLQYYDLLETELSSCLPIQTNAGTAAPIASNDTLTSSPLNSSVDSLSSSVASFDRLPVLNPDQYQDEVADVDSTRQPLDTGLTAHLHDTGRTDLDFINETIHKVTTLHNRVDQESKAAKLARLTGTSKRLYYLHKEINKNISADVRQRHQEEYNNLQYKESSAWNLN